MAATTASAAAGEASVEQLFESCREVPKWTEQITVRALVVSLVLGFFLSFIIMKLNLTTGIIPSLNVSAGLLGFFLVKTWMKALEEVGVLNQPFTRQENTVIQTCVVACAGVSFSGKYVHIRAWDEQAGSGQLGAGQLGSQHQGALSWLDDRFPFPRQLHWLVFHPAPDKHFAASWLHHLLGDPVAIHQQQERRVV